MLNFWPGVDVWGCPSLAIYNVRYVFSLEEIAFQEEKKNKWDHCRSLGRTLSKAGFTHVDVRPTASVPIGSSVFLLFFKIWLHLLTYLSQVKFHDPASGLDCDINVNDRLGLLNSSMIKEYCDAHPFLRPLLYRIKKWAKPLGLNSPSPVRGSSASFSSYAFALMTISFLQVRHSLSFPRF